MQRASSSEVQLKHDASRKLVTEKDPLKRLQLQCLKRGAAGIKGLGRMYRIIDDSGNRKLEYEEFKKGLHDYGLEVTDEEAREVFKRVDVDSSGFVDYDEFLTSMRPMNANRVNIVKQAYAKLDRTGDGIVNVDDLKTVYDVRKHPKFLSGELTQEQLFKKFLAKFEPEGNADGVVTENEFINYYAGISASIDHDAYFDLMIRTAWKL